MQTLRLLEILSRGSEGPRSVTERSNAALRNASRVRDHLANERTYLAWMRTAIAMMGFGVVIVRLRYIMPAELQGQSHGWQLGLLFAGVGLLCVFLATRQYYHVRNAIDAETYEPAGHWIAAFSVAVLAIGVGVAYFLLHAPAAPLHVPGSGYSMHTDDAE